MLRRISEVFLVFLSVGCARAGSSSGPVPAPESGVADPVVAPNTTSGRSWIIVPATEPHAYRSTTTAVVELLSDSGSIRDSLTRLTTFSLLTATASGSTSFLGSVEAVSTSSGTRIEAPGPLPAWPLTFTGHITNAIVVLDALKDRSGNVALDCSSTALATLKAVHRSIISLPAQLYQNLTWRDSTIFTGCSGTIPTTTISIRVFRVLGEIPHATGPAILLEETGKLFSTGEGSQDQHRIVIRSEGTATARVQVNRMSGALLEWDGQEKTSILVTAGRSHRFTQTVREVTTVEH